jgi:hypothetical protein
MAHAVTTLRGEKLAKAYAASHPLQEMNPGKVWATYEGGGWIELRGEGLAACPAMQAQCPNGWSLLHKVRSGKARKDMEDDFSTLRDTYISAGNKCAPSKHTTITPTC